MALVGELEKAVGGFCQAAFRAYHAFSHLDRVNSELRGLSFNAEIACVRGGQLAVAVRPLAQYTRELAEGLITTSAEVERLRGETHRHVSDVLCAVSDFGHLVEGAEAVFIAAQKEEVPGEATVSRAHLATVMPALVEDTFRKVEQRIATVRQLERLAATISDSVRQARSIANQIAIQAAGTAALEQEFTMVATALHTTVGKFGAMTDEAMGAVRDAHRYAQRIEQARTAARSDRVFRAVLFAGESAK